MAFIGLMILFWWVSFCQYSSPTLNRPPIQPLISIFRPHWKISTLAIIEDPTHFQEGFLLMDTEPSSPLNIPTPFTIIETVSCCLPQHWLCHYLIPCLTLAGDSPVVPPTKQTQTQVLSFCIFTHSQKYDNNAYWKVRQRESPRSAKIWPLPPTITNHHHSPDMRTLISPVLQHPPGTLWGRSQTTKSKFVLVCPSCLLLSLIYGVGSAFSKSQTDTCACWPAWLLHQKVQRLRSADRIVLERPLSTYLLLRTQNTDYAALVRLILNGKAFDCAEVEMFSWYKSRGVICCYLQQELFTLQCIMQLNVTKM